MITRFGSAPARVARFAGDLADSYITVGLARRKSMPRSEWPVVLIMPRWACRLRRSADRDGCKMNRSVGNAREVANVVGIATLTVALAVGLGTLTVWRPFAAGAAATALLGAAGLLFACSPLGSPDI